ncbi:HEPN domain-containing protein [bacterium]|nr:HEPN domain-containing protein [bacterium]
MSELNPDIIEKVRQWADYADEDLRLAVHALQIENDCPCRLIAYHAQQCVEKYLKAFLVMCGVDFPYTHNIGRLVELLAEQGGPSAEIESADELTPYAITTRYPGEDEEVAKDEAINAVEIAKRVREVIRRDLPVP